MELTPPRGTQDLLPPLSEAVLHLAEEAHRTARLYGFRYVDTPTFEHTEVFSRTSGETSDVVTKEMYTFEDKGGRSLTLRPESTAGVVRAYLANAHDLGAPWRAYYVNTNYRHNRPQTGRLREFRVFGVEVIGTAAPGADVEVISIADRFVRERGLGRFTLHLNSIGDEECRPAYREALVAHFEPYRDELDEDCRLRLEKNPLRILDCKVDGGKDFVLKAPVVSDYLCDACEEHYGAVRAGLDELGILYQPTPRLVRGLDYYTRTAFEFISSSLGHQGATFCGGGRYDGLAEVLGGRPTPGVGFGMGLDRVLLSMEKEGVQQARGRGPRCFVVTLDDEARRAGRALVGELRDAGVSAAASYEDRPMKAQLKMADRSGAEFAAILGAKELADGVVTLRRLADGFQQTVPSGEVAQQVARPDDRTDA